MIDARYTDLIDRYAATRIERLTRGETVWVLRAYEPEMSLRTAAKLTEEYFSGRTDGQRG